MTEESQTIFSENRDKSPPEDTGSKGGLASHFSFKREEARAEVQKELTKEETKNRRRFNDLCYKSDVVLLKVSNIFPFDFFPDDLVIDVNKVNVVSRIFFFSETVHSIAVKDILDVFVECNILFATVKIIDRNFIQNLISIDYLWRWDAFKARRMIQGLIIASREGVDLSKLEPSELLRKVEGLGRIKEVERVEGFKN